MSSTFGKRSLADIIKQACSSIRILETTIEDDETSELLERLEDLKPSMRIRVHITPELGREGSFTFTYRILGDWTVESVGGYVSSYPKVEPLEDTSKYNNEATKCKEQIFKALKTAIRHLQKDCS